MREFRFYKAFLCLLVAMGPALHAADPARSIVPSTPSTNTASEIDASIRKMRIAPGFKLELFASEPLIQNPVSFAFDEKGRAFVVETHRRRTSVFDIRNHSDWLDDDFSFRTVADRSNFFRKVLVPGNKDLPARIVQDRNGDGAFDYRDLEVESEKLRLLFDDDKDGKADRASTFAEGFNTLVSGVAAGVLPRKGDVYFACIPDLWLLRDTNNDGESDFRKRLATGFGVHISFGGHDLHGLRFGPDGKLYFSIADRGLDVESSGRHLANPDSGAVLRCNPDGSDLEIVATGFRNPQELVFDQYGNLWTGDNNGDGGDKARWLYVVEGGDYGWHLGWQHLPGMGMWNYERLWDMAPTNTSAHVLPAVAHVGHGPAGIAYYPGTGLPAAYQNHFFMSDFPGAVRTFSVLQKGAGYEVTGLKDFMTELWPVDVDFGPEPGLYVLDWVHGWDKTGKGRLYRLFDPEAAANPLAAQTRQLLADGLDAKPSPELGPLLSHADYRIRLEAQFTLASRGLQSTNILLPIALSAPSELARLHAIWGLGQIAESQPQVYNDLLRLTEDWGSAEVRAQALKVLGEGRYALAYPQFNRAASDNSPRVRYFALLGLGKIGNPEAIESIISNLRTSGTSDAYIRHAAVMALTWLDDMNIVEIAARDSNMPVRLGALLAMRRLQRPEIAMFLYDNHPLVALEAARAIYDVPITNAMSQLASLINKPTLPRAAMKRVLHANYRLGRLENSLSLSEFGANTNFIGELRAEAIDLLGRWGNPAGRDLLVGAWRPLPERDARAASLTMRSELPNLLKPGPLEVRLAAIQAALRLEIDAIGGELFRIFSSTNEPGPLRLEALRALATFKDPKLRDALKTAAADSDAAIRKEASTLEVKLQPANATSTLVKVLDTGTIPEKQNAIEMLAKMQNPAIDPILLMWLDRVTTGKAPKEMHLEILEAARQRTDPLIKGQLERYEASRAKEGPIALFSDALVGGDAEAGRKIFFDRTDVQCLRCHKLNGTGGEVGPDLAGVGTRLTREMILESLVAPNARMTPGYENLIIKMKGGESYVGFLQAEDLENVIINSPEDGLLKIPKAEIENLDLGLSAMPPEIATMLSRRDLRNVVEFLANQK